MKSKLFICGAVMIVVLFLISTMAMAGPMGSIDAEVVLGRGVFGDVFVDVDGDYGPVDEVYERAFDTRSTGLKISGVVNMIETIAIRGSYMVSRGEIPVQLGAVVDGALEVNEVAIAGTFELAEGVGIGAGYLRYGFAVKAPGYSVLRSYSGFQVVGMIEREVSQGLFASARVNYSPVLAVSDRVTGFVGDPDRTAEAAYEGSLLGFEARIKYGVWENLSLTAGYAYSMLSGRGDPAHADYHFLEHTYRNGQIFVGGTLSF